MNKTHSRCATATLCLVLLLSFIAPRAGAVEALLLQDTYVDNGTSGGKPPNAANYGSEPDLRVFKGNGRIGRAFLKFSLATLPPAPPRPTSPRPASAFGSTARAPSPDRSPSAR